MDERGWQPIETAPKDGTRIRAKIPGHGSETVIAWHEGVLDGKYPQRGGWEYIRGKKPPDDWSGGFCREVNDDGKRSTFPVEWMPL